jgi:hypothetical protein
MDDDSCDGLDNVRDASQGLGQLFINAVREKDEVMFKSLLRRPDVLWGEYMRKLSPDDQKWAREHVPQE